VQINLGFAPHDLAVALARDGDFVSALVADTAWPVGSGVELRFSASETAAIPLLVWAAQIVGVRVQWDRPAADCRAVLNAGALHAQMIYVGPSGSTLLWGRGRVRAI